MFDIEDEDDEGAGAGGHGHGHGHGQGDLPCRQYHKSVDLGRHPLAQQV